MNLLYCGDKNIADGVILSVISFLENSSQPLNIFIMTASIKTKNIESLDSSFENHLKQIFEAYGDFGKKCSVKMIDATIEFNKEPPSANLDTRFTPCCMLRLYADCFPDIPDKILYLDNDVLCRCDPAVFYNTDIENYDIAGVLDYYGSYFFRKSIFKRDYINSGVILLNMKRIRASSLFARCRSRCADKKMFMPDQSALNKEAKLKLILPRRYNDQRKLHNNTVLQHFTTTFRFFPRIKTVSVKPWQKEKMHTVLKLFEYDYLFEKYNNLYKNPKKIKEEAQ